MFTVVRCPSCGGDWTESDVRCPTCGYRGPAEEVVASWVGEEKEEAIASSGKEAVCLACGYEGTLIPAPDADRELCPACGTPWQDRGGILRKATCPECRQVILLTEQHRGKTVICPGCHSLLGCLVGNQRRGGQGRTSPHPGGRSNLFELMILISAVALGLTVMLTLWEDGTSGHALQGTSIVVLPICWAITLLRMLVPRVRRGRRFSPPGAAACLAVTVASLLNMLVSANAILTYVGPRSLLLVAMLHGATPLPSAAAVTAVWVLLLLDDRWRLESTWIDRFGRCLGLYWLMAGLVVPTALHFL